ncbi:MAG: peptide-methionine (S)-S-oxide reductase MsrA [archaeon]
MEKAYFAAGCFWHTQEDFDKVRGVVSTSVGYSGGKTPSPSYEQVCSKNTGHAETIEIEFDEKRISYADLLKKFFSIHDPVQKDGQGADIGSNYRSAIFFVGDKQKKYALDAVKSEERRWGKKVATEVKELKTFYPASEYHQKYYLKHAKVCGV